MTARSRPARSARARAVVLRGGAAIADPLTVVLASLQRGQLDRGGVSGPGSFGEADLRLANRAGARISAVEIAAILERRRAIERALRTIDPGASLVAAAGEIPWTQLARLFGAFAGIRGVGFSKMTKALHPKRPELIPMLDSIVQHHLAQDDPGPDAGFAERALALVRGYKRELDRNRQALQQLRRELAGRGRELAEVRILDLLIVSVATPAAGGRRRGTKRSPARQ